MSEKLKVGKRKIKRIRPKKSVGKGQELVLL